jgi:hypothetical protein
MALTHTEYSALVAACRELRSGPDYRCNDYVTNLINTVLDFQMHTEVVGRSIAFFHANHTIRSHRKLLSIVNHFPDTKSGNLRLAEHLWGYRHWTRAKFLREILAQFDSRGIRGQESLRRWFTNAEFDRDVKGNFKTKEHSIGIALFHWLQLRLGVDTVKPDVHILRFVSDAIGRKASRKEVKNRGQTTVSRGSPPEVPPQFRGQFT